jgi:hypothetical protein
MVNARYLITLWREDVFILHKETIYQRGVSPENYVLQEGICYGQVGSLIVGLNNLRERIRFGIKDNDNFSIDRTLVDNKRNDISKIILEEVTRKRDGNDK